MCLLKLFVIMMALRRARHEVAWHSITHVDIDHLIELNELKNALTFKTVIAWYTVQDFCFPWIYENIVRMFNGCCISMLHSIYPSVDRLFIVTWMIEQKQWINHTLHSIVILWIWSERYKCNHTKAITRILYWSSV